MQNSLRRAAAVLVVAIMPIPFVTGQNSSGRLDSTEQQNTALPNLPNPYRTRKVKKLDLNDRGCFCLVESTAFG
jgi:hypothetical protein